MCIRTMQNEGDVKWHMLTMEWFRSLPSTYNMMDNYYHS